VRFRLPPLGASARQLRAEIGYDPRGFLHVSLTNDGAALSDAAVDLLVPSGTGPGWIARVDQEGQPMMEDGGFVLDADEALDGAPSLHWHETGLGVPTGATLLRFFVGVATEPSMMPVVLRLTASPAVAVEFASTVSRTPLP